MPSGEHNGRAKLTVADVEFARISYATGRTTIGRLARKLKVSRGTIADVLKRRTWRHVWSLPTVLSPA
jgi:hypothetical protein